jgi:hypothetical protein
VKLNVKFSLSLLVGIASSALPLCTAGSTYEEWAEGSQHPPEIELPVNTDEKGYFAQA